MHIELKRENFTHRSTEGSLYVEGTFQCYTLEDRDRFLEVTGEHMKVSGLTCVPRGDYKLVLSQSNKFKVTLPEILEVPYFTGIRIHSGNYPEDTEGCILVGSNNTNSLDDFIGSSKVALNALMEVLSQADEEITITIN